MKKNFIIAAWEVVRDVECASVLPCLRGEVLRANPLSSVHDRSLIPSDPRSHAVREQQAGRFVAAR